MCFYFGILVEVVIVNYDMVFLRNRVEVEIYIVILFGVSLEVVFCYFFIGEI